MGQSCNSFFRRECRSTNRADSVASTASRNIQRHRSVGVVRRRLFGLSDRELAIINLTWNQISQVTNPPIGTAMTDKFTQRLSASVQHQFMEPRERFAQILTTFITAALPSITDEKRVAALAHKAGSLWKEQCGAIQTDHSFWLVFGAAIVDEVLERYKKESKKTTKTYSQLLLGVPSENENETQLTDDVIRGVWQILASKLCAEFKKGYSGVVPKKR